MNTIIIILLSASALLFILSFFQKDRTRELEKEVEQLSIQMLQEHYTIKKRMNVLEEELLIEDDPSLFKKEPNKILINHVLALFNQGLDLQQISKQSSLSVETVRDIINGRT